jgi:outer membrane biosynthesis protein TonB
VEEYYKAESRAWREKSNQKPVQQETTQPSAMTPAPPKEPENSTIAPKEISVKEKPTQPSAENKPSPVCTPSTIPQDSPPQGSDTTNQWHLSPFEKGLIQATPYLINIFWNSIIAPRTGIYLRSPTRKHSQNGVSQKEKKQNNHNTA